MTDDKVERFCVKCQASLGSFDATHVAFYPIRCTYCGHQNIVVIGEEEEDA